MVAGVSNETAMNPASKQRYPLQTWICTMTHVTQVGGVIALEARIERTTSSVARGCGCHIQVSVTMQSAWRWFLRVHLGTSICVTRATCLRDTSHGMVGHAVQQLGWDTYTVM